MDATAERWLRENPWEFELTLFWRVANDLSCRHGAAASTAEPSLPVRACDVADVRDRLATKLRRSGHAPARHDQLALTIHAVAHDRRKLVGEDYSCLAWG
jgi:hypothetical protein